MGMHRLNDLLSRLQAHSLTTSNPELKRASDEVYVTIRQALTLSEEERSHTGLESKRLEQAAEYCLQCVGRVRIGDKLRDLSSRAREMGEAKCPALAREIAEMVTLGIEQDADAWSLSWMDEVDRLLDVALKKITPPVLTIVRDQLERA